MKSLQESEMICLRCGCCCVYLDVIIVNPSSLIHDGTIDKNAFEPMIQKPKGVVCPHLIFENNKTTCKIHELPCYKGTPCEQFEQLGNADDICIMSSYFDKIESNTTSKELKSSYLQQ
jgi:hypothetical protein